MKILYLASDLQFPDEDLVRVRGNAVMRAVGEASELLTHYRVGHPGEEVITGGERGRLYGEAPAVLTPDDFWDVRPNAVVLEGGLTTHAMASGQDFWWRDHHWRLPANLALEYLLQGGVVVALDATLGAAGDAATARRVFGSPAIARVFGAVVPVSLDETSGVSELHNLIDWRTGRSLIQCDSGQVVMPDGMADVLDGVPTFAVFHPIRVLPVGEPLIGCPLTVGSLRSDLAPVSRPDAWTRLVFASYHRHGKGWSALIAGDITAEDERFDAANRTYNPRFVTQLVRHLVRDAKGESPDSHHHSRSSHDLPDTRWTGVRVLVLTATETEREAVMTALPPQQLWDVPLPVKRSTSRHPSDTGVEFFHARVGKGVKAVIPIQQAINAVQPRLVIMVGICAGLGALRGSEQTLGGSNQALGDVVVADTLRDLVQGKIRPGRGGAPVDYAEDEDILRVFPCDPFLVPEFRTAAASMQECVQCSRRPAVHFGEVLASPYVIKSTTVREWIRARYPEAVALEMEGGMLAFAGAMEFADLLLVKGICDWADDHKDSAHQPRAAANAIALVLHVFTHAAAWPGSPEASPGSHPETVSAP